MEKKKYITPECEVMEIELESHLLGLSFEVEEDGFGSTDNNEGTDKNETGDIALDNGLYATLVSNFGGNNYYSYYN